MAEWWQKINGYDSYEVSKSGKIRNKNGKILKQQISNTGYARVCLYDSFGKPKLLSVHRLVATAFIENQQNKPCVNHIDNNPLNNNVKNLEWVTYKENMEWASIQGRMKFPESKKADMSKIKAHLYKPIIATDKDGNEYYFDRLRAVDKVGFNSTKVSLCCRGIRKTTGGLKWRFANEEEKDKYVPQTLSLEEWNEKRRKPKTYKSEYNHRYWLVKKQKLKEVNANG